MTIHSPAEVPWNQTVSLQPDESKRLPAQLTVNSQLGSRFNKTILFDFIDMSDLMVGRQEQGKTP